MALITRVSRLFKADFHAVLDHIEEPDLVLKQAIRDMEDEVTRDEQRHRQLQHEQRLLHARENDLEHSLSEIEQELDVCFDSGKDELARKMIRHRLEAQSMKSVLMRKRKHTADTIAELDAQSKDKRRRLDSMRQKAEMLAEEIDAAYPVDSGTFPPVIIHDEDVEVAFLREKQNRRAS